MRLLKKISIVLAFMAIKNFGFAQVQVAVKTISTPKVIQEKPTEAERLTQHEEYIAKKLIGDSLVSFDGNVRMATPKKKIVLENP